MSKTPIRFWGTAADNPSDARDNLGVTTELNWKANLSWADFTGNIWNTVDNIFWGMGSWQYNFTWIQNQNTNTWTRVYYIPNGSVTWLQSWIKLFGSDFTQDDENYDDLWIFNHDDWIFFNHKKFWTWTWKDFIFQIDDTTKVFKIKRDLSWVVVTTPSADSGIYWESTMWGTKIFQLKRTDFDNAGDIELVWHKSVWLTVNNAWTIIRALRANEAGQVGVNNTNPTESLDVTWNIKLSWNIVDSNSWVTPTLLNGWVTYWSTLIPRYRKTADGTVHIQWLVKNWTATTVFNLPTDYRPQQSIYVRLSSESNSPDWSAIISASSWNVILNWYDTTSWNWTSVCFSFTTL